MGRYFGNVALAALGYFDDFRRQQIRSRCPSEALGDSPITVLRVGNMPPESIGSVMIRPGKAVAQRARRRTRVRRTSDASGNAARADQGLPSDPG
jgi:hypothetical protein